MNTSAHRATHRLIVAVIAITLSMLTLVGCATDVKSMSKDFPCNSSVVVSDDYQYDNDYLGPVAEATFPEWYVSGWDNFNGDDPVHDEWKRLILILNGFTDEDQVTQGATIKIPARCSDDGAEKPERTR